MEALTGPTLEAAIRRRGRIAVGRMVEVAVQLLEALQAVHREGIVHGDVKPSNIQLCRMSRAVRAIAVTTAVGTAPCRPPSSSTSLPCARPTTGAVLTMDSAIPTMRLAMSMARAVPTEVFRLGHGVVTRPYRSPITIRPAHRGDSARRGSDGWKDRNGHLEVPSG